MNPMMKIHGRLYSFLAKGGLWWALAVGIASMWSFGIMSMVLRMMTGHCLLYTSDAADE